MNFRGIRMSKYKELLDGMTFSFSRLHSYETCPYQFYKKYIECDKSEDSNFYADNGKLMHRIFEKLLKGKMTFEEAIIYYEDEFRDLDFCYDEIKESSKSQCYESCVSYLSKIKPLDLDGYEILGVEKKVFFKIDGHDFVGIIDLELRDEKTKQIIIVDHKSSTGKIFKKDGSILKSQAENFQSYKRQLYLYSAAIREEVGEYPGYLAWHHFRDNGAITKIRFNQMECDEARNWAANLIKRIYNDEEFEPVMDYVPCHVLCGYRNGKCEYLDYSGV